MSAKQLLTSGAGLMLGGPVGLVAGGLLGSSLDSGKSSGSSAASLPPLINGQPNANALWRPYISAADMPTVNTSAPLGNYSAEDVKRMVSVPQYGKIAQQQYQQMMDKSRATPGIVQQPIQNNGGPSNTGVIDTALRDKILMNLINLQNAQQSRPSQGINPYQQQQLNNEMSARLANYISGGSVDPRAAQITQAQPKQSSYSYGATAQQPQQQVQQQFQQPQNTQQNSIISEMAARAAMYGIPQQAIAQQVQSMPVPTPNPARVDAVPMQRAVITPQQAIAQQIAKATQYGAVIPYGAQVLGNSPYGSLGLARYSGGYKYV